MLANTFEDTVQFIVSVQGLLIAVVGAGGTALGAWAQSRRGRRKEEADVMATLQPVAVGIVERIEAEDQRLRDLLRRLESENQSLRDRIRELEQQTPD